MVEREKELYETLEPRFLWDYLHFGIDLRDYIALRTSDNPSSQNDIGRKLSFISVLTEMMAGFEDTAGLILALKRRYSPDPDCEYQKKFKVINTPLFYTLVKFRESSLDTILGCASPSKIYKNFHFENLVLHNLSKPGFLQPDVVRQGLLNIARFLCKDCLTNQTKTNRQQVYNKIKHGGIVVSEARDFFPEHPLGVG